MTKSSIFFAGLSNLNFPGSAANGERYADKYIVTSDRDRIRHLIQPFSTALGSVEFDYLSNEAPAVIYRRDTWQKSLNESKDLIEQQMIYDLIVVQRLLLSLWLTKDNSATLDNGWIFVTEHDQFVAHTNSWAVRPSCSDGTFSVANFDAEEFRRARRGFNIDSGPENYLSGASSPTLLGSKSLRFQRFLYLIGGARSAVDVAIKIALYCSALESLVSTAQTELSHQVSERVAALLAPAGRSRVEIFALVKEAYGYRSKAVHGASFKGTAFERLRESSVQIDDICRRLSTLYLSNTHIEELIEGRDENINSYFVDSILGHSPQDISEH